MHPTNSARVIEKFGNSNLAWIFLFILTLTLRLMYLDYYPLNIDEPFTVFYSQMPLCNIGEMLKTENNPPLFFMLLHYWIKLFGISEFSVRFLPALFSALTVIVLFFIGKNFFSVKVAFVASILFIFSESHFEFSHDSRAYTLLVLLSTMSIYFLLRLLKDENKRNWIFFGLINTLLVYTHFIGWIIIFLELIFIISAERSSQIKKFAISYSITLLTLGPYLPVFFNRVSETTKNGTWVKPPNFTDLYTRLWDYSNKPLVTVLFIFIFLVGSVLLLNERKKIDVPIRILLLWFLIPYLGLFLISFKLPLFIERYLLIISIPFYILLAVFIEKFSDRHRVFNFLFLLLPLTMLLTSNFNPSRKRPNEQIVQLLRVMKDDSTALIISTDWFEPTFLYYNDRNIFGDYQNAHERLKAGSIFSTGDFQKLALEVKKNYRRIIYFQSNPNLVDTQNQYLLYLKSNFNYIGTANTYNCKVSVLNCFLK